MNSEAQPGDTEVNHVTFRNRRGLIALHCKNIDEMTLYE